MDLIHNTATLWYLADAILIKSKSTISNQKLASISLIWFCPFHLAIKCVFLSIYIPNISRYFYIFNDILIIYLACMPLIFLINCSFQFVHIVLLYMAVITMLKFAFIVMKLFVFIDPRWFILITVIYATFFGYSHLLSNTCQISKFKLIIHPFYASCDLYDYKVVFFTMS